MHIGFDAKMTVLWAMIKNLRATVLLYFTHRGHLISKCLTTGRREKGVREERKRERREAG